MFKTLLSNTIVREPFRSSVFLIGLLTLSSMSLAQSYLFNKLDVGVGMHPISIVSADFNRDSKLDLATANEDDNTVSVLLGKTDGTFEPHVDYEVGSTPVSVTAGDLNGDGRPDLAVANLSSNNISILLGRGD